MSKQVLEPEIKEEKEGKPEEEIIAPKIINALLQKGIDFDITVNNPSIFHRLKILPKIRIFKIYPACAGVLLNISEIILTMENIGDLDNDENLFETGLKNIIANKDKMLDVVSLAVLNRKISNPYLMVRKWLIKRFLDRNISTNELLQLIQIALMQMGVTDFLASTVSIKRMNLMGTAKQRQPLSTGGK